MIAVDRWYPSSKTCSRCQQVFDELRLDERAWTCTRCGTIHDRDHNAALNLLTAGRRQLAGCESRDLRAEGRGACTEATLAQVLPVEARSGQPNEACLQAQ